MAALLISTSMRPKRSITPATARSTEASSPMSATRVWSASPCAPFSFNASSSPASRSQIDTEAPPESIRSATARPMPWPPPVTTATRPSKS